MAKTSLIITSTADGKTQQKAISDVNPAVSSSKLAQFATQLVGLTTNTYQKTDRLHKLNCDTEVYAGDLREPTLELSATSVKKSDLPTGDNSPRVIAVITTDSDGAIYLRPNNIVENGGDHNPLLTLASKDGKTQLCANRAGMVSMIHTQTFYVGVLPTATYSSKEVAFEVID